MKRKNNEAANAPVVIIASKIRRDDPSVDCNDLRDVFVEEGAEVKGELVDGETRMIVTGLNKAEVEDILDDYLADTNCMFGKDYILEDIMAEEEAAMELECDEPLTESCGRKKYQSLVDEDGDIDLSEDAEDEEDLEPLNSDYPGYNDVDIDPDRELAQKAYTALAIAANLGDEIDGRYIEDNAYELIEQMDEDPDSLTNEEYMHYIDILKEVFNDNAADFADFTNMDESVDYEDTEDEAYNDLLDALDELKEAGLDHINFDDEVVLDSVLSADGDNLVVYAINIDGRMDTNVGDVDIDELTDEDDFYTLADIIRDSIDVENDYENDEEPRFEKIRRHGRLEEKKRGCCPKKSVNENVKIVLDDLKKKHIAAKANQKLMNEQLDSTDTNISNKMLVEKVKNALKANQTSLHENVKVNGKSLKNFSNRELKSLYAKLNESKKTLNESKDQKLIDKRVRLMEYIDQELTYRENRLKYIIEDDNSSMSDDELSNLFGPMQDEDSKDESTKKSSDDSDDEEVELSRIEITLKSAEALKDLKDACIEAEIPEEAFECEGLEDEEDPFAEEETSDEEEPKEDSEEKEESTEEETEESDEANESVYYKNISRLFEDDEDNTDNDEQTEEPAEEDSDSEENTEENTDGEESEEETVYKFILTDTDYAVALAKVLDDVYGISKEEFEEMIGGEIVEEDTDKDSEEKSEDEHKEDSKEKTEEDDDEIDPSELFKGL